MNLEQVKARMAFRDHWMLLDESGRAHVIQSLADDVPGLVQEIERLAGVADRANKSMEKHQKHNGALEISVQEAHRELDGAVKDGNRLADALVKSREEVLALKFQLRDCANALGVALTHGHPPSDLKLREKFERGWAIYRKLSEQGLFLEKRKDEGGNPWAPNKDYPGKPVQEKGCGPSCTHSCHCGHCPECEGR